MNNTPALPMLVLALALSACSREAPSDRQDAGAETAAANDAKQESTADTPITKDNYEKVMEARSREYEAAEWKKVTLTGYSCGDNCYVEFQPHIEGGADMTALCSAKMCKDWDGEKGLPAALKNKTAEVKYGKAPRFDGSGKKVDDYRNITEIRILN